jgi:hypothetical protein
MELRIVLVGQRHWVRVLRDALIRTGEGRIFVRSVDIEALVPNSLSLFGDNADLLVRVGLRPGARTVRGQAFDLFWSVLCASNKKARVAYFWIGTDVMNAAADENCAKHTHFFRGAMKHLHIAGSQWLADELTAVGVSCRTLCFPGPLLDIPYVVPFPPQFTVLSYVPDNRFRFYGGHLLYDAAIQMPGVRFDILGGTGRWARLALPNMLFHGWVTDMVKYYNNACIVARVVEHDGLGATVQEGLLAGRHVIYTYPVPFCSHVKFGDYRELVAKIEELHHLYRHKKLEVNLPGRRYALAEWDPRTVATKLIACFEEYLESSVQPASALNAASSRGRRIPDGGATY